MGGRCFFERRLIHFRSYDLKLGEEISKYAARGCLDGRFAPVRALREASNTKEESQ
jgi:hypothetical protein